MNEKNVLIEGELDALEELSTLLIREGMKVERRWGTAPLISASHDATGELAVIVLTIAGITKPLLSALAQLQRDRLEHKSQKALTVRIKGRHIELKGFDEKEVAKLSAWLSRWVDNDGQ